MQIQNEVNISLHTVVINVLFSWCTTKYKVIRVKNRSFTKLITSKQWCNIHCTVLGGLYFVSSYLKIFESMQKCNNVYQITNIVFAVHVQALI